MSTIIGINNADNQPPIIDAIDNSVRTNTQPQQPGVAFQLLESGNP